MGTLLALDAPHPARAANLCWSTAGEQSDYKLSLIDPVTGREIRRGTVVDKLTVSGDLIIYEVPPDLEPDIPTPRAHPDGIWTLQAMEVLNGRLETGVPTIVDELRCQPPYALKPARLKPDFTCDNRITISDTLAHMRVEVLENLEPCE